MPYREILNHAINAAELSGASYADARVVEGATQHLTVKNGVLRQVAEGASLGIGIRVFSKGGWGFASTKDLSPASVAETAQNAAALAKASASVRPIVAELAPAPKVEGTYRTPCEIDPFSVSLETKVDTLLKWDSLMRSVKGIALTEAAFDLVKASIFFANTEGSRIAQYRTETGAGMSAIAVNDTDFQIRSYPNSFRGQHCARGWELLREYDFESAAPRIAEEAVELLSAPQCQAGIKDIVIGSSQLGLQIHESCGHPAEFDRILGYEANFAGESFMRKEDLGKLAYGSPLVTLYSDATIEGALGSYAWDDEGVASARFDVVKGGILSNFLTSRDTAPLLGQTSNGTARADGWHAMPLIRMTNLNMEPGNKTLDELIGMVDDGIYLDCNKTWSIDHYRINFQFGCEFGREIKNGKLGKLIKNPQYTGKTVPFWNSCTAVGNAGTWKLWGLPNCGKGQPMQIARVAHGAPAAMFRNVQVGVGYGD